jgi:hypothetical protein
MSESSVEIHMGKAYGFLKQYKSISKEEIANLLPNTRLLEETPEELILKLVDLNESTPALDLATKVLTGSSAEVLKLADLVEKAKLVEMDYMLEATLPGGSHILAGEKLGDILTSIYLKLYPDKEQIQTDVAYKHDDGTFIFRASD